MSIRTKAAYRNWAGYPADIIVREKALDESTISKYYRIASISTGFLRRLFGG